MTADESLRDEGERFGRYLIGDSVPTVLVDRYVSAMRSMGLVADGRDRRLLGLVERHPGLLGVVDGGLALRRPGSVIRTKLLVMSAILEATPDYASAFLPARRSRIYIVYAGLVGVRAGCKGLVGAVLVSVI
jgi:hypothetical protein